MVMFSVEPTLCLEEIGNDKSGETSQIISWPPYKQLMCSHKCNIRQFSRCKSTAKTIAKCAFYLTSCMLITSQLIKLSAKVSNDNNVQTLYAFAEANQDANRLYEDLMMSYNRFVRPVQNDSDTLVVKLGLKLSQLIDVVSITCKLP